MKSNIGSKDKLIRFGIAMLIAALIGAYPTFFVSPFNVIAGIITLALIFTASFGSCPLYTLFGFNTRKG